MRARRGSCSSASKRVRSRCSAVKHDAEQHGGDRRRHPAGAQPPASSIVKPPSATAGEHQQRDRGDRQVALDHRRAGDADQHERQQTGAEQHAAASASAAAPAARRGREPEHRRHAAPAASPGGRGTRGSRSAAATAAAAAEVLGRGARVVQREQRVAGDRGVGPRPQDGRDGGQRARSGCGRASVACHGQPAASTAPASTHASGRSSPAAVSSSSTGRAAPRLRRLQRRRPHDHRHVRDVDVAARGQERVVEAGSAAAPRPRADQRREGEPSEPVDAGDQRQEGGER